MAHLSLALIFNCTRSQERAETLYYLKSALNELVLRSAPNPVTEMSSLYCSTELGLICHDFATPNLRVINPSRMG